jgi:hypoxanthine phosphoribosyltransferase
MDRDIERVLISRQQIATRVRQLAAAITADHSPPAVADGNEITIVPILTGAMMFCCDLVRESPMAMRIGMLAVSSYPGSSVRSQGTTLLAQQLGDVRGHHVLLVDDVLDSGGTLRTVLPILDTLGPLSVRTCVLLRKDRPESRDLPVDYVGFEIPDHFVVGYGLDYNNYYRNLPDIVILKDEAIERRG